MKNCHHERIHMINCLYADQNALYHQAALKLGLSDSAMLVLYMLYYKGDGCPLYDICREGGISKQTINSALRKLETEDILFLESDGGRAKRVRLTGKGKQYVMKTGARLYKAECAAFDDWNEEEMEMYMRLMQKYNESFSAQIEKMEANAAGEGI